MHDVAVIGAGAVGLATAKALAEQGRSVVVRETARAVHVLNAVSPGLTCSLPFGEELARRALAKL